MIRKTSKRFRWWKVKSIGDMYVNLSLKNLSTAEYMAIAGMVLSYDAMDYIFLQIIIGLTSGQIIYAASLSSHRLKVMIVIGVMTLW